MEVTTGGDKDVLRNPTPPPTSGQPDVMQVQVSSVVFTFKDSKLCVLGVAGKDEQGLLLPAYRFQSGMSLADAASLALKHEAGITIRNFYQIGAYSADVRNDGSTVEIAFFAPVHSGVTENIDPEHQEVDKWIPITDIERFEPHAQEIIQEAVSELRQRSRFEDIAFSLLPPEFSLSELQKMFESVLGRSIDVRNFRKKIEALDILVESENKPRGMAYRPPRLFRFSKERFQDRMNREGEVRFF